MSYDVYIDKNIAFSDLSKEEAEKIELMGRQMIIAGVKTNYTPEQIHIELHSE
tara:strand:+ start:6358 stop:6516 length:159 start_codon:yes stop_codon:yes gene_type:complete